MRAEGGRRRTVARTRTCIPPLESASGAGMDPNPRLRTLRHCSGTLHTQRPHGGDSAPPSKEILSRVSMMSSGGRRAVAAVFTRANVPRHAWGHGLTRGSRHARVAEPEQTAVPMDVGVSEGSAARRLRALHVVMSSWGRCAAWLHDARSKGDRSARGLA